MKMVSADDLPSLPRKMQMDVPSCPACGLRDHAVREKVIRGDTAIAFWCCPPCGFAWRERPMESKQPDANAIGSPGS